MICPNLTGLCSILLLLKLHLLHIVRVIWVRVEWGVCLLRWLLLHGHLRMIETDACVLRCVSIGIRCSTSITLASLPVRKHEGA